jgi:membrane-bound lytic murein transglycosylase B
VTTRATLVCLAGLVALAAAPSALAQGAAKGALSERVFRACVDRLAEQTNSANRRISRADFRRIARDATYQDRVRVASAQQVTEPALVWDDVAATVDDERVAAGAQVLERAADTLRAIEAKWGVDKEVLVAIYGIETDYGARAGSIPVLDAALTLACLRPCPAGATASRCPQRERAFAAARVLRDGHAAPETFVGSWAAAFGRTQFVPDTFEELAVDFDSDGRKDVIGSEADAWASTANFLRRRGPWRAGLPLFVEVDVPARQRNAFERGGAPVRQGARRRPLSAWIAEGWRALEAAPAALPPGTPVYPFAPVGLPGPVFLVTPNFDAVLRYNPGSLVYALQVGLLARKLAGGGDPVTPWPTDDPGLSRAQIRTLQQWLAAQGHDKVVADGIVGAATRDAIEAERAKKGLPAGRRVGVRSMQALMRGDGA